MSAPYWGVTYFWLAEYVVELVGESSLSFSVSKYVVRVTGANERTLNALLSPQVCLRSVLCACVILTLCERYGSAVSRVVGVGPGGRV